ncbi:hypothetical protein DFH09DRAFT_1077530 [Mycena vulgaris]|nr:hypothetical protein DFH09DRAFT_1077530 [Mycena vulgaris]
MPTIQLPSTQGGRATISTPKWSEYAKIQMFNIFRTAARQKSVSLPSRGKFPRGLDGTGRPPVAGTRRTGATGTANSSRMCETRLRDPIAADSWTPESSRMLFQLGEDEQQHLVHRNEPSERKVPIGNAADDRRHG